MDKEMFRFSREKRLMLGTITFADFISAARTLTALVEEYRPAASVEVLTCEDFMTYQWSTVTFSTEKASAALTRRRSYLFDEFDHEVWCRSLEVGIYIKDKEDPRPFMIALSCDKHGDDKRMFFYGQAVDADLYKEIGRFRRPNLYFGIGDGYHRSSLFNFRVGEQVTGIKLT